MLVPPKEAFKQIRHAKKWEKMIHNEEKNLSKPTKKLQR